MKQNLRFHRVLIGRKCLTLDEDLVPLAGRPVERHHHQMQIDGQRVHHHDFVQDLLPRAPLSAPSAAGGRASMDSSRESGPRRQDRPSRAIPARYKSVRFSVEGPRECPQRYMHSSPLLFFGMKKRSRKCASGSCASICAANSSPGLESVSRGNRLQRRKSHALPVDRPCSSQGLRRDRFHGKVLKAYDPASVRASERVA